MDSAYSFSLTTFSPSGKLGQIENALAAVSAGATALGIKGMFSGNVDEIVMICSEQRSSFSDREKTTVSVDRRGDYSARCSAYTKYWMRVFRNGSGCQSPCGM